MWCLCASERDKYTYRHHSPGRYFRPCLRVLNVERKKCKRPAALLLSARAPQPLSDLDHGRGAHLRNCELAL